MPSGRNKDPSRGNLRLLPRLFLRGDQQRLAVTGGRYRPLGRTDGGVGPRAVQVAADELVRPFLVRPPVLELGAEQAEEGLRSQAEASGVLFSGNPGPDRTHQVGTAAHDLAIVQQVQV